jgi:hypothetical protein
MLLNDVPTDKRLAYLLDLHVPRQRRGRARRTASLVVLGAGALLLLFAWALLKGH